MTSPSSDVNQHYFDFNQWNKLSISWCSCIIHSKIVHFLPTWQIENEEFIPSMHAPSWALHYNAPCIVHSAFLKYEIYPFFIYYIKIKLTREELYWCIFSYTLYTTELLSVPKFTANLYCICIIIPQIYTEADAVQICGKFWYTQYIITCADSSRHQEICRFVSRNILRKKNILQNFNLVY